MNPAGQRHFKTAAEARTAARNAGAESFVVLHQLTGSGFKRTPEYAWVGPTTFFLTRMVQAMIAGITVVKEGE